MSTCLISLNLKQSQPKVLLRTLLTEHLPKSVVLELQNLIWPEVAETSIGNISDDKLEQIAKRLSGFELKPSGTEGYRTAEVTLGGVDTSEVSSKTMESKTERLVFCGRDTGCDWSFGRF